MTVLKSTIWRIDINHWLFTFNTRGISRTSLIIKFSQYVDDKKLGEFNLKKKWLRIELWAEFNRVEIIRDKFAALVLDSNT